MASREGKDGKHYCTEGPIVILSAVPFFYVSRLFGNESGMTIVLMNQFLTSVVCLLIYIFGRQFGYSRRSSLLLTAIYGLGTMAFVHSKYLFPEPITSIFYLCALLFLFKYKNNKRIKLLILTGIFTGATLLLRPDSIFFILGITGAVVILNAKDARWQFRHLYSFLKRLTPFFIPVLFFLILFALYNYLRFGSFFEAGYGLPLEKRLVKVSYPQQLFKIGDTVKGFLGMWIVPNRSIFFINPILIFFLFTLKKFWRKFRFEFYVLGFIFLEYVYLYSNRGPSGFPGSAAWGVRYMLPMISLMVLPIGLLLDEINSQNRRNWKRIFGVLLIVSVVIQLIGSSVNYQTIQMPVEKHFGGSEARLKLTMDPSWSLLFRNVEILSVLGPSDFMFYNIIKQGTIPIWISISLPILIFALLSSSVLLYYHLQIESRLLASEGEPKKKRRKGRKKS